MDLDDRSAQISYWLPGEQTPETVSAGGGEESRIPAVLCRRMDPGCMDLWKGSAGDGAQRRGHSGGPPALPSACREQVEIGGEVFEAAALLALFIKRSLSLLGGSLRRKRRIFSMFTAGTGGQAGAGAGGKDRGPALSFRRNGYPARAGRRVFSIIISVSRRSCGGICAWSAILTGRD